VTLRNRVGPDGLITDAPLRGTFAGNRGILHVADGVMGPALWQHRAWICCILNWQGRRRDVMRGRTWTELFFLDEAVAMAAGHRPCAYCREFVQAWGDTLSAPEMDAILHKSRAVPGARRMQTYVAFAKSLPNGCFVQSPDGAALLWADAARLYGPNGYGPPRPRPSGRVTVLGAPAMIQVLRGGYAPELHPSVQSPLFP